MKYENAFDILPAALAKELQRLVPGRLIYVPTDDPAPWGTHSGARQIYAERNRRIRAMFEMAMPVADIAAHFYLTEDTVRRIIRKTKL